MQFRGVQRISQDSTDRKALGVLHVEIVLTDAQRTYYGSDDPIHGTVVLRYVAPQDHNLELFAPLQLDICLGGIRRIAHGTDEVDTLCKDSVRIHNGPFRAENGRPQSFPFSITFPEHAISRTKPAISASRDENGRWVFQQHLRDLVREQLPPSLFAKEQHTITRSEVEVVYRLLASAKMPGIGISCVTSRAATVVLYDQPRVPQIAASLLAQEMHTLRHEMTVREKSAAFQSFRTKTVNLFRGVDDLCRTVSLTCDNIPKHVFVGQPISLKVVLSTKTTMPRPQQSAAVEVALPPPEVTLDSCVVSLFSKTIGTSPAKLYAFRVEEDVLKKEATCVPPGPFARDHDFTKTIDIGALSQIPSTYLQGDAIRRYKIRLSLCCTAAGHTTTVQRLFPITVHSPLLEDAVPISYYDAIAEDAPAYTDERPPAYTEVVAAGGG